MGGASGARLDPGDQVLRQGQGVHAQPALCSGTSPSAAPQMRAVPPSPRGPTVGTLALAATMH